MKRFCAFAAAAIWITPFGGYRLGGSMALDDTSFSRLEFQDSSVYGLAIGAGIGQVEEGGEGEVEFMWTHQDSTLRAVPKPGNTGESLDMNNDQFHLNGLFYPSAQTAARPYVLAGLGVTRFAPAGDVGSLTRFSWALGAGSKIKLTPRLSLRLEAKWNPALAQSSGSVFCNSATGRCFVTASGDLINQFDFTAGLALRI